MCFDDRYTKTGFAFEILQQLGVFPLNFRYVKLIINGEHQGVYIQLDHPSKALQRDHLALAAIVRRRKDFLRDANWVPQDEKIPDVKLPNKVKDPKEAAATLAQYDELAAMVTENSANGGDNGGQLMERLLERMDLDAYLTIQAFNSFWANGLLTHWKQIIPHKQKSEFETNRTRDGIYILTKLPGLNTHRLRSTANPNYGLSPLTLASAVEDNNGACDVSRDADSSDETYFYTSSGLWGSWYWHPFAWDPDDILTKCHAGGTSHELYDPYGLLYCAESDIDHAILDDPTIYRRFVDRLHKLLTDDLPAGRVTARAICT
eukprot:1177896-Prorocentrum_minimum.AAC.2